MKSHHWNPLNTGGGNHLKGDTLEGGRAQEFVQVFSMSDIETKLGQIATVINQIDDPKVPRNIRKGAKEACEQWLLNKSKEMDIRIAITQAKLEELYEDPNIPPEFGTLILMINTELEKILRETL